MTQESEVTDPKDDSAASRREAIEVQKDHLENLTKSRAWGMLRAFIEEQVEHRMNHIMLNHVSSGESIAEQNFMRGECAMGKLLVKYLEEQLKVTKETVELYRQWQHEQGEKS